MAARLRYPLRTSARTSARTFAAVLALALGCGFAPVALAAGGDTGPEPGAAASPDRDAEAGDAGSTDAVPALLSFGVAAGLPSYRTLSVSAALQTGAFGVALRAGYGPGAGGSIGLTARYYPPLPAMPVPVWIGGGGAWTGAGPTPHLSAGVHVPVAPRWRIDAEAGVAWPRLGLERHATPHLTLGVSYAFAVRLGGGGGAATAREDRERVPASACEPGPRDEDRLDAAARRTARRFVDDARAGYGSLYRDPRWTLELVRTSVRDDVATVVARFDGSVREIASGDRIHAAGEATATFRWTGCGWRTIDLAYDA